MNQPKRNYQKELDKLIADGQIMGKKLLLHSCCAPCSSYCMEYLREYFDLTVFYYNPNITEEAEYQKRVEEEKRLIRLFNEAYSQREEDSSQESRMPGTDWHRIKIIEGDYEAGCFYDAVKGLEQCKEGGERCFRCYELRLRESARVAKELSFDYFTTTLTISPLKNADKLNEIGEQLGQEYGVSYLPSDFKKKNGYQRSIALSKEYGLYRQDYCGCIYSKVEREKQKAAAECREA